MDPAAGAPPAERNTAAAPWRIGVDVGGTFTDVVVIDAAGRVFTTKSLTRPSDPAQGVLAALDVAASSLAVTLGEIVANCDLLVHGSTVATNTLLEHSGARVGLLVTEGFRDSLEIRRGARDNPWDHRTPYPPVLVPRYLRLPIHERIDRHGEVSLPLEDDSVTSALATLASEGVDSIAICLINSYLNPAHERRVAEIVRVQRPDLWVTVSSDLLPLAGEYERTSTTVVDAYVAPKLISYLRVLEQRLTGLGLRRAPLLVKNNGGTALLDEVVREPVTQTLSGPAAAVGALRHYGGLIGGKDLISVEIGGTSCDLMVMENGEVAVTDRLNIGHYETIVPSVDIHTIGAGGGSIAALDKAGVLNVGPRGSGAEPGPACYGRGGTEPTVTDAQLIMGRLRSGLYAGGALALDRGLAERAVREKIAAPLGLTIEAAAAGIVRVAEHNIRHAIEQVTIERGLDPRRFSLVAGGGAGGLHGAVVGRLLSAQLVYVPRLAGVFCAFGMLNSHVRHDHVRSHAVPLDSIDESDVNHHFEDMERGLMETLVREGFGETDIVFERSVDLRYRYQQWDVRVCLSDYPRWNGARIRDHFEANYERLYAHRQPDTPIEMVKLRITGTGIIKPLSPEPWEKATGKPEPMERRSVYLDDEHGAHDVPVYAGPTMKAGHRLLGPCIVEEATTTILVGPEDRLEVDQGGNYVIRLWPEGD